MSTPQQQNEQPFSELISDRNPKEMLVCLKREVTVKRYPIIAKITFLRERPDLVSLLNAAKSNSDLPPRLLRYLEKENLWDNDSRTVTDRGENVIEAGSYPNIERGLYHIWYTEGDPLLGTRPILIQRDSAVFEPTGMSVWQKGVDASRSPLNTTSNYTVDFIEQTFDRQKTSTITNTVSIESIRPEVICSCEKEAYVNLSWDLNLSTSHVTLTGNLDVLDFRSTKPGKKQGSTPKTLDLKIEDHFEKLPTVMTCMAEKIDGGWQEHSNKIVVSLENIEHYTNAVQRFYVDHKDFVTLDIPHLGTFNTVKSRNLPIKPSSESDAEKWRQLWLNTYHEKTFISTKEAHSKQSQWLDHESISEFNLALKTDQKLLDSFQGENQKEAFLRVAAITDLSIVDCKKQHLPITLMNQDSLDLYALINQISNNATITSIIYSDRYVNTTRHSQHLSRIAQLFTSASGLLLTLTNSAELPSNWTRETFKKESDNHGRYWILKAADQTYCWECSSSLDFIRDEGGYLRVEGTPTFTPKAVDELPRYLADRISTMTNLES